MRQCLNFQFFFLHKSQRSNPFSQSNGRIIERVELKNFGELIQYIKITESRDSVGLNQSRFEYPDKVQV